MALTIDAPDHAVKHHPEPGIKDELDRSFFRYLAYGYLGGFITIFVLMFVILLTIGDAVEWPQAALMSGGVAFWIGIMGGAVAVGAWTQRHGAGVFGH
jgi:hypothetical protein